MRHAASTAWAFRASCWAPTFLKKETALQAKDQLFQMKVEFDKESKERRSELNILEKRLLQKEEHLEKKIGILDGKDADISNRQKSLDTLEKEIKDIAQVTKISRQYISDRENAIKELGLKKEDLS